MQPLFKQAVVCNVTLGMFSTHMDFSFFVNNVDRPFHPTCQTYPLPKVLNSLQFPTIALDGASIWLKNDHRVCVCVKGSVLPFLDKEPQDKGWEYACPWVAILETH